MFRPSNRTAQFVLAMVVVAAAAGLLVGSGALAGSPSSSRAEHTRHVISAPPGSWQQIADAPIALDVGRTGVWTGAELLVSDVEGAAAYNPHRNAWRLLPAPPKTQSFCRRSAVWTGREMLVWGCGQLGFNPATNIWRRLPAAPTRQGIVVWTGRELIGWGGGCCGDVSDDGSAYNPVTNTWRKLAPAPVPGQQSPTGAWTGRELVIFSGSDPEGKAVGGAAYNPATDTWRRIPFLPDSRQRGKAVWDGREILVVGGSTRGGGQLPTSGLAYEPLTNRMRPLSLMDAGRLEADAVWTGRLLLVWGGQTGGPDLLASPRHGLAYDPQNDHWSALPEAPISVSNEPIVAWTGDFLLVWGGVKGTPVGTSIPPKALTFGALFRPRTSMARPSRVGKQGLARSRPSTLLPQCC